MNALWMGLALLLATPPAHEQERSPGQANESSEADPSSERLDSNEATSRPKRMAALAQFLDSAQYPPAFSAGVQAELQTSCGAPA
jgi:hypothetical protein